MIGCVSSIAVCLDKMSINDVLVESSHDRSEQCVLNAKASEWHKGCIQNQIKLNNVCKLVNIL